MTLGEFRKITASLPDNAKFADEDGVDQDYTVEIRCEYDRLKADGPIQPTGNRILLIEL